MTYEIPPEGKDPAIWGGVTAFILMRLPLVQRIAYFVVGVTTAKFLAPQASAFAGTTLEAASYLLAVFSFLMLEKLASIVSDLDAKQAAAEMWAAIIRRIGGS